MLEKVNFYVCNLHKDEQHAPNKVSFIASDRDHCFIQGCNVLLVWCMMSVEVLAREHVKVWLCQKPTAMKGASMVAYAPMEQCFGMIIFVSQKKDVRACEAMYRTHQVM